MFYSLFTDEGRPKKFAYGVIMDYPDEHINCSVCGREWRNDLLLCDKSHLSVVLTNDYFPDFLFIIHHKGISQKAKEVMEQEGVTGYHLRPLHVLSANDLSAENKKELSQDGYKISKIPTDTPPYYRLFMDSQAELHEQSGVYLLEECRACGYDKYHIPLSTAPINYVVKDSILHSPSDDIIRKSAWDGSDLFHVKEYPGSIYCTERFYKIYREHKLTGLLFQKVESL